MTMKAINVLRIMPAALLIVLSLTIVASSLANAQSILPSTTISISGTQGNADWYKSDVVVTLSATDMTNAGINRTEYSFNGTSWQRYTGPINITKEGSTPVYYRSIDNASGVESVKIKVISIDKTPPTITYTLTSAPRDNRWSNKTIVLHFESMDDISGLGYHTPDSMLANEGPYTSLYGVASDVAGNSAGITVPDFYIDKTPPALGNLTIVGNTFVDKYISASARVVEDNPDRVEMDWGDDTVSDSSISNNVAFSTHAYKRPGKYTVALIVTDKAGNVARSEANVTVNTSAGQATPTSEPTPVPEITPTPTPLPATPTPAPGMALPLTCLATLAGALMCLLATKKG